MIFYSYVSHYQRVWLWQSHGLRKVAHPYLGSGCCPAVLSIYQVIILQHLKKTDFLMHHPGICRQTLFGISQPLFFMNCRINQPSSNDTDSLIGWVSKSSRSEVRFFNNTEFSLVTGPDWVGSITEVNKYIYIEVNIHNIWLSTYIHAYLYLYILIEKSKYTSIHIYIYMYNIQCMFTHILIFHQWLTFRLFVSRFRWKLSRGDLAVRPGKQKATTHPGAPWFEWSPHGLSSQ